MRGGTYTRLFGKNDPPPPKPGRQSRRQPGAADGSSGAHAVGRTHSSLRREAYVRGQEQTRDHPVSQAVHLPGSLPDTHRFARKPRHLESLGDAEMRDGQAPNERPFLAMEGRTTASREALTSIGASQLTRHYRTSFTKASAKLSHRTGNQRRKDRGSGQKP